VSIRRTAARSLGVLALLSPALGLVAAPANASAADFVNPSSDGQVVTDLTIRANAPGCTPTITKSCPSGTTLTLKGPGGTITATAKNSSSSYSVSASVPADAANGKWTADLSGGNTGSRTFYTSFAPATPTGFTAEGSGAHDVLLSWAKGTEPDLTGYVLYDGAGNVLDGSIAAGQVCSGSRCSYALYYDNPTPGTYTYDYQLSALRSSGGCSTCGTTVESARTADRSASLTTPKPAPSPTPEPTTAPGGSTTGGGGSTSGSGGTTGSGGSTSGSGGTTTGSGTATKPGAKPTLPTLDAVAAQRRAFALNFSAFAPSLGIPKLPPLPATTLPSLGSQPLPEGTYKPQLPYQAETETSKSTNILSSPIAAVSSIDQAQLARSLAIALILLLTAAHLRRFLGTHVEE
jgi:hypothetical protein